MAKELVERTLSTEEETSIDDVKGAIGMDDEFYRKLEETEFAEGELSETSDDERQDEKSPRSPLRLEEKRRKGWGSEPVLPEATEVFEVEEEIVETRKAVQSPSAEKSERIPPSTLRRTVSFSDSRKGKHITSDRRPITIEANSQRKEHGRPPLSSKSEGATKRMQVVTESPDAASPTLLPDRRSAESDGWEKRQKPTTRLNTAESGTESPRPSSPLLINIESGSGMEYSAFWREDSFALSETQRDSRRSISLADPSTPGRGDGGERGIEIGQQLKAYAGPLARRIDTPSRVLQPTTSRSELSTAGAPSASSPVPPPSSRPSTAASRRSFDTKPASSPMKRVDEGRRRLPFLQRDFHPRVYLSLGFGEQFTPERELLRHCYLRLLRQFADQK